MGLDPWTWTVADVQAFFRHRAADYIQDLPLGRLPGSSAFLPTLEALKVDGPALLSVLDGPTLREDCGVKDLQERGAVIRCIVKLRRQSMTYATEHGLKLPTVQTSTEDHPQSLELPLGQTSAEDLAQALERVAADVVMPAPPLDTPTPIAGQRRRGEELVEDGQGRKRRKLDLSGMTAELSLIPKNCHLSDAAFSINEMFFGNTAYGHEIKEPKFDGEILQISDRINSLDDNFRFISRARPAGNCHMAYSRMHHFLNNPATINLERDRQPAIAVLPYRSENGADNKRSAMVVQFKGTTKPPIATREHATQLDREDAETEAEVNNEISSGENVGEWDFLMDKYNDDNGELLDVYGKATGDREEFTITATDDESDRDSLPEAEEIPESVDGGLKLEEVDAIIETFIKEHVVRWKDGLPGLEKAKAWTVWNRMKKSRALRATLIQSAQARIAHITTRLVKAKREILADQWADKIVLQQACRNLEAFIEDREEARWKISIWQSRQEPFHKIRRGRNRPAAAAGSTKSAPSFVPNAADRLDFVPAVQESSDTVADANEIIYEADDEQFHTPNVDPVSGSTAIPSDESLRDFVVDDQDTDYDVAPTTNHDLISGTPPTDLLTRSKTKDSSYGPSSLSSDSEDELPSASRVVKFRIPQSTAKTPIKSHGTHLSKIGALDLDFTELSSASPVPKKRGRPSKSSSSVAQPPTKPGRSTAEPYDYGNDPLKATSAQVATWDIRSRIDSNDRTRLLILLLRKAGSEIRDRIYSLLLKLRLQNFQDELVKACKALGSSGEVQASIKSSDIETMEHGRDLYVHWFCVTSTQRPTESLSETDLKGITDKMQARHFTMILNSILQREVLFAVSKPRIGSSAAPVMIPSSSDEAPVQKFPSGSTPRKTRMRKVLESKTAQQTRQSAAERQRRYEESQGATDPAQLAAMIGCDPAVSGVEINPVRDEGCDPVYIPEHIAKRMKAHQIDGVRFLWREVTASGDEGGQGCILAHTMGLGKTMQTIALLVTLDEVAHSDNRRQRSQLPERLCSNDILDRQLRMLVISPPSLLQNWRREIDQWSQKMLGGMITIDSANKAFHLQNLEEWMKLGGVLLIGYHMFRNSVNYSGKRKMDCPNAKRIEEILLKGPEIVVADEAHNLKNDQSGVAQACNKIETHTRIGLTGTPMSNDVQEIYALVSFAAPGFLGEPIEFRAHYAEPIQDGLYNDSTAYEKRKSLMKLQVLHSTIQPKVNRANIEVLRGSLKPKIEFVLTVPLGAVQTQLYLRTVTALLSGNKSEDASQVAIFGWLSVLTLLTNHPHCFRARLKTPPKPRNKPAKNNMADLGKNDDDAASGSNVDAQSPEESEAGTAVASVVATHADGTLSEADPFEKPLRALGFTEEIVNELLEEFDDSTDAALSAKMCIFLELLTYSLSCKDKVLVFSSSILTLDFLGQLLRGNNYGYGRIDGQTPMAARVQILESFHRGSFDIMLVSTRAGGVGLNIQGANRVFIFDFGFNPTHEEQAIGRAYRLGQTKPVFVYRFVAGGTFERNIYNRQLFKTGLAQRVVDKKTPRRTAERKTRDYLYPPMDVEQEDLQEWLGKDPEVLDKLLAKHGDGPGKKDIMIRAIKTMETLQEDAQDAPLDELEQTLVNQEIEEGKRRPKGRKAAAYGPPNGWGPASTQGGRPPPPGSGRVARPPPSTYAAPPYLPYIGGLPLPNEARRY